MSCDGISGVVDCEMVVRIGGVVLELRSTRLRAAKLLRYQIR